MLRIKLILLKYKDKTQLSEATEDTKKGVNQVQKS